MAAFIDKEIHTATAEYSTNFWNAMRCRTHNFDVLKKATDLGTGCTMLPVKDSLQMEAVIGKESVFRNLASVVTFYGGASTIFAHDCNELAAWVPEGAAIPLQDAKEDFSRFPVSAHKLAVFVKIDEDFANDSTFGIETYLMNRIAKNFAKAEDEAFLLGMGEDKPTGILSPDKGAEIGATTNDLSYDDIIKLYFSVKDEYRRNGTWLMNDRTALSLLSLKDERGTYLWNMNDHTLLGKPVIIMDAMPNIETGNSPVLFGDFHYYWVIRRSPVHIRTLREKFVLYNQIGYLAIEYMDGKLIRRDTVKALKVTE